LQYPCVTLIGGEFLNIHGTAAIYFCGQQRALPTGCLAVASAVRNMMCSPADGDIYDDDVHAHPYFHHSLHINKPNPFSAKGMVSIAMETRAKARLALCMAQRCPLSPARVLTQDVLRHIDEFAFDSLNAISLDVAATPPIPVYHDDGFDAERLMYRGLPQWSHLQANLHVRAIGGQAPPLLLRIMVGTTEVSQVAVVEGETRVVVCVPVDDSLLGFARPLVMHVEPWDPHERAAYPSLSATIVLPELDDYDFPVYRSA
jgi:hypothetical protein